MKAYNAPKLHSGQWQVASSVLSAQRPHISVLACGARWGKDRLCVTLLLAMATHMAILERERREKANLIPRVLCWYVAPTFSLLRQMWEELTYFGGMIPGLTLNRADLRAFLPGGIQIEFKSADNPGSLLARGLDMVVATEAARIRREAWENSLLTRLSSPGRGPNGKGGIAVLNSTPNGRNWFYELYQRGLNDPTNYVKSWHFTSFDSPLANREELMRHKAFMPDLAFRQEYLAEFLAYGGSVFRRIENSFEVYPFPCSAQGTVVIGIDWGRYDDRTVAVAIDAPTVGKYRVVNVLTLDKMPYERQMQQIKAFCDRYPSARIIAESNGLGDPLIAQLRAVTRKRIEPFATTAVSKRQIVDYASMLFEQGSIMLPAQMRGGVKVSACENLTNELSAFEIVERATGYSFSAPAGQHDDHVMAFCIALSGRQHTAGASRLDIVH